MNKHTLRVTVLGAAGGEVTGSMYLVEGAAESFLVDSGSFQGGLEAESSNIVPLEVLTARPTFCLLTHGHLDHGGRLLLLVKEVKLRAIFATKATCEMALLVLKDSVKIESEAHERRNRKRAEQGMPPTPARYTEEQLRQISELLVPIEYHKAFTPVEGVTVTAVEAGHMLGSASLRVVVNDKTVIFSGDIGPHDLPLLRDAENPGNGEVVFLESTYGDRNHRSLTETIEEFAGIVSKAVQGGGKIIVPAFAIGRTQQIIFHLAELTKAKKIPNFPVFIDSPMAIEASKIYFAHPELFDQKATALLSDSFFSQYLKQVKACANVEESKKLNDFDGPCMIIAGSGMCQGGRVVHHLKHQLAKRDTVVMFVGFQGRGTLGRRLIDGASAVEILGDMIPVRAQMATLGGFSAHAGQRDLVQWAAAVATPTIYLTHGEDKARKTLATLIEKPGTKVVLPQLSQKITI